ncbi:MAG: YqaA family protein [Terriglobia bacterium]
MHHLSIFVGHLGHLLSRYGGWGLFVISFLDSSFLAFPFINDLLLIKLSSVHPHKAILYTLQCMVGSVLGAYLIYWLTRQGSKFVFRRTQPSEKSRIRRWMERNDFLSILIASLLPPPAPFKIFAILAGGLRINALRFLAALVVGRGIRFGFESWLGVYYGAAAQQYLKKNFLTLCIIMVAVLVAGAILHRFLKHRRSPG